MSANTPLFAESRIHGQHFHDSPRGGAQRVEQHRIVIPRGMRLSPPLVSVIAGESSRGNTIRGNRIESLWEGNLPLSERTSENLWRISENLWRLLKTSEDLWKPPLRDPLRGRFLSQRLSVLLPLFICPLKLSLRIAGCLETQKASRPPDYSSNVCPPKAFAIWLFEGCFGPPSSWFSYIQRPKTPPKKII